MTSESYHKLKLINKVLHLTRTSMSFVESSYNVSCRSSWRLIDIRTVKCLQYRRLYPPLILWAVNNLPLWRNLRLQTRHCPELELKSRRCILYTHFTRIQNRRLLPTGSKVVSVYFYRVQLFIAEFHGWKKSIKKIVRNFFLSYNNINNNFSKRSVMLWEWINFTCIFRLFSWNPDVLFVPFDYRSLMTAPRLRQRTTLHQNSSFFTFKKFVIRSQFINNAQVSCPIGSLVERMPYLATESITSWIGHRRQCISRRIQLGL